MANKQTIAQTKYDSTHCRTYGLKLNLGTDADIIAKLASVPSMQGYIKQLIRQDIISSVPYLFFITGSVPKNTLRPYLDGGLFLSDKASALGNPAADFGYQHPYLVFVCTRALTVRFHCVRQIVVGIKNICQYLFFVIRQLVEDGLYRYPIFHISFPLALYL